MSERRQYSCSCLSLLGKETLTLVLAGIFVLPLCSLVGKKFHKMNGATNYGMLPLNELTRAPTVTSCASLCSEYDPGCEAFIFDKVKFDCVFGGRLLTVGVKPSPGQTMYTTGRFYCDGKLGYFLTSFGLSELCARVVWAEMTYSVASSDCIAHHGRLLTVKTTERNSLVLELMKSFNNSTLRAWVGLSDIQVEGEFVWSDGSRMTADQTVLFRANQPDDAYSYGEDCCEYIYAKSGNGLNDGDCRMPLGHICEYVP